MLQKAVAWYLLYDAGCVADAVRQREGGGNLRTRKVHGPRTPKFLELHRPGFVDIDAHCNRIYHRRQFTMGLFILTETSAGYALFKATDKKLLKRDDYGKEMESAEGTANLYAGDFVEPQSAAVLTFPAVSN